MKQLTVISTTILLAVFVGFSSCYKKDDFIIQNDKVIHFADNQPTQLIADGATLLPVQIELNKESDKTSRTISITVANAKFRDGSSSAVVIANDSGIAVVNVYSTGTGQASLVASVGNYRNELNISLLPALPERVLVTSSSDNIPYNGVSGTNIIATLQRDTGLCSSGLSVIYTATDSVGQSHGNFYNIQPTDATASSKATFRVNDLFYGTIHIKAKFARAPGDTVVGENLIFLHR